MSAYTSLEARDFLKNSLTKVYGWMGIGLALTGLTSTVLYTTGWFLQLIQTVPAMAMILLVAQVVLVLAFSFGANKLSATGMKIVYLLYALTLGFTMTSLAYVYDLGTISLAFLITAVYFFCLVAVGMTTNLDLSKIGVICMIGLIAIILSQILMMIFHVSLDTRLMSIFGLLIFTGLTAYDVQRANVILSGLDNAGQQQEKMVIYMALQLYLDFINIFLYIVRILGSRRD